jgi:hypothetical protein
MGTRRREGEHVASRRSLQPHHQVIPGIPPFGEKSVAVRWLKVEMANAVKILPIESDVEVQERLSSVPSTSDRGRLEMVRTAISTYSKI